MALSSILCGQTACGGPLNYLSTALVISILPPRPRTFSLCIPQINAWLPTKLTKHQSFLFELTNPTSAWEPQSIPPSDPNKGMCPCHSLCLSLALTSPVYFLQEMGVTSFSISIALCSCVKRGSPSDTWGGVGNEGALLNKC